MDINDLKKLSVDELRKQSMPALREIKNKLHEEISKVKMQVALKKAGTDTTTISKLKRTLARLLTIETEGRDTQATKTQETKTQETKTQETKTQETKTQETKTQETKTQETKTQADEKVASNSINTGDKHEE